MRYPHSRLQHINADAISRARDARIGIKFDVLFTYRHLRHQN